MYSYSSFDEEIIILFNKLHVTELNFDWYEYKIHVSNL